MTSKRPIVELEELRNRLREAEETLGAIRNGEVDSLVVSGPNGEQVFSLKGAEQPYRIFLERMSEGALTLTTGGTILYGNRRFAEMVGFPLERVIGAQFQSFLSTADQDAITPLLQSAERRAIRAHLQTADNVPIAVQFSFNQMLIDDVEAVMLVVTDMTEHDEKRELGEAMQRLREAQDKLQAQNKELEKARAVAEEANVAKDNFLAALSHELRTPLTPVLMAIRALRANTSLAPEARRDIELVHRNVEMEARLIDDLLDLTRVVRGKVEMKSEVLDVHTVVGSALEVCHSDAAAKRLHISQDLRARQSHIHGDAVRVQQILWNLLRNAIKFTPEGGQITIISASEGDTVRISVSDTGIGIDPQALEKIFTPFEQANRLITRRFGGLGLGLAISRRLAELHGGTVIAQSDGPGKGSTFTLMFPVAREGAPRTSPGPQAPSPSPSPQLRILVVEDHEDTRESLVRLLRRKHIVRDVRGMESALDAARDNSFDLLISDLGLPDGSGLELMRQLRSTHKLKGICLSGFGMDEDISRSTAAGFSHHLTKPIDFDRLDSLIDSLAK